MALFGHFSVVVILLSHKYKEVTSQISSTSPTSTIDKQHEITITEASSSISPGETTAAFIILVLLFLLFATICADIIHKKFQKNQRSLIPYFDAEETLLRAPSNSTEVPNISNNDLECKENVYINDETKENITYETKENLNYEDNENTISFEQKEEEIEYFNGKHIDEWSCNELQEWINSLDINHEVKQKVLDAIAEQECSGADFNSMEEGSEVIDAFEIEESAAAQIFSALQRIRNANDGTHTLNVSQSPDVYDNGSGIIGLDNLRNTCFINTVIQGLLQTDGLIQYLRNFNDDVATQSTMLAAFIFVAKSAMEKDAKHTSVAPRAIVKHLRSSDVRFGYGEQGDALSAVSKMIELLDIDIINVEKRKRKHIDTAIKKHTRSWYMEVKDEDDSDSDDEEEIIEGNLLLYNPYESVIRECIHFVERNTFTCMQCGWKEARYDIKEKILLPLKDHSSVVYVDIYVPGIKQEGALFEKEKCVILDYCPVETLKYQIFDEILRNKNVELNGFEVMNVNQITILILKPDRNKVLDEWMEICDEKEDCSMLMRSGIKSIYAVIDTYDRTVRDKVRVTTFHLSFDGEISYIEFDEMFAGEKKSFITHYSSAADINILFDGQIFLGDYECEISDTYTNVVIVVIILDLNEFVELEINQVVHLLFDTLFQRNNVMQANNSIIKNISDGFSTYCSTKVMDRGAVLKCGGKCQRKCDVFKQERKIVKYSNILIFAIDRYINDRKFHGVVDYDEFQIFDGNAYELYAVCNHSGDLGYGHYWAFVKCIDDNQWYNANDSSIRKIKMHTVINQATAILLFYKKSK